MDSELTFRYAERKDTALILKFIKGLAEKKWDLHYFFITFLLFWEEQAFIWRIYLFFRNTGERDMAKLY